MYLNAIALLNYPKYEMLFSGESTFAQGDAFIIRISKTDSSSCEVSAGSESEKLLRIASTRAAKYLPMVCMIKVVSSNVSGISWH